MTSITIQDGKLVLRDGAIGTEQACCCGVPGGCEGCALQCEVVFLRDGVEMFRFFLSGVLLDSGCTFEEFTGDLNVNGDGVCIANGEIIQPAEGECEEFFGDCCAQAGGVFVFCQDQSQPVVTIKKNNAGECIVGEQIDNLRIDEAAYTPNGPCPRYTIALDCNPLP
jgi:hypothetical protein